MTHITYDELKSIMYGEMSLEERLLHIGHEITVDVICCTPYKTVEEKARRWQKQLSKILWPEGWPKEKMVIPENVYDILRKGIPTVKYIIGRRFADDVPPMIRAKSWLTEMKVEF